MQSLVKISVDLGKARQFVCSCLCAMWLMSTGIPLAPLAAGENSDGDVSLTLSGTYRLRYEFLDNPVQSGQSGATDLISSRLLVKAEARKGDFFFGGELQDSRVWSIEADTPLGTDDVNVLEPLQIYAGIKTNHWQVRAGRLSFNVGSRRLLARNGFRNTINAYSGIEARFSPSENLKLTGFYVSPVNRRPSSRTELARETARLDKEDFSVRFWGLHGEQQIVQAGLSAEAFLYRLDENDDADLATANRDLWTLGGRLHRKKAVKAWDFDLEGAYQWGESRTSRSPELTQDLDHSAYFLHAEAGYSFSAPAKWRLALQYEDASGDKNPVDGRNQRFSTLFGVRRGDFGHTGIFSGFTRENIRAFSVKTEIDPSSQWHFRFRYSALWLNDARDAAARGGLQDMTGAAGRVVGQQLETRVQWRPAGSPLTLEAGGLHLIRGRFLEQVPQAGNPQNPLYFYLQGTVAF